MLTLYGPAGSTACLLSIGTGIGNPVTITDSLFSIASGVPEIATNSAVNDILLRSLIDAYAPEKGLSKYWRFSVGDGLPKSVQDKHGNWWWKLREKIGLAKGVGALDDTDMIPETVAAAREYIAKMKSTGKLREVVKHLQEGT